MTRDLDEDLLDNEDQNDPANEADDDGIVTYGRAAPPTEEEDVLDADGPDLWGDSGMMGDDIDDIDEDEGEGIQSWNQDD